MDVGYHGPPDRPTFAQRLKRRAFMRLLTASAGTPALLGLLAACGGAATMPTIAPSTSATTPTGGVVAPPGVTTPPGTAGATPTSGGVIVPGEATGTSAPTTGGIPGGQVSFRWITPVTFSPLFSIVGAEQGVERLLFGALVKVNDKLDAVPDIAEKVEVSPDAQTYTFTLRKTLQFTDGVPLTAKDVVFTLQRAVDKRVGSYWRGRLLSIVGAAAYGEQQAATISGLETPDAYTVKMTLTAPDATWLLTLGDQAALGILPEHALKDVAPDQLKAHPFTLNPNVSAGVFRFSKYAADQYLELQRNESYGGTKAKLDKIFAKILPLDGALAALEKGDLDLMIVPVQEVARLKKVPALTVLSVPSPSVSFITANLTKAYLQDKRLRQAMMYAIDREAIVKEIYKGEATVANHTIIGPEWMGIPTGNEYKFDPAKARQLLKAAGWDSGRTLEAMYIPGAREQDAYAPIIQQQWQEVGLAITLRQVELAEYIRKRNTDHDFELAFVGGGVFRQDPNVSSKYFETPNFVPSGANYSHYSNKRVDQLFAAGRATTDKAKRKESYTEVAMILNDEVPWVFLWSPNSIFAHNKRLVGFKPPSYAEHQMWNAEDWSVRE
jgi:ABC-type transport system substrate-binding protein